MDYFMNIVNSFLLLTIFTKHSILDIRKGSEYASWLFKLFCCYSKRDTIIQWIRLYRMGGSKVN